MVKPMDSQQVGEKTSRIRSRQRVMLLNHLQIPQCKLSKIAYDKTSNASLTPNVKSRFNPKCKPRIFCQTRGSRSSLKCELRVSISNANFTSSVSSAFQPQREPRVSPSSASHMFQPQHEPRVQREIRVSTIRDSNLLSQLHSLSLYIMENKSPLQRDLRG